MLYGACLYGYTPHACGLQSGPAEWIILRMARKRKLANYLSYLEHWINFHIIYYPLYMLIMQVYHDSGRMHDFGHMPDSDHISRLRSHFLTPIDVTTSDVSPDSSCASRLWSMSALPILPPQLWKTSHGQVRWLQHLTTRTLSQKQTGRDAWLDQCSKHHIAQFRMQE
jgi:hypothetical protein